ncbi:hypothetical protein ACFFX0_25545 [Citricoccus parietis]|uniref:Uncharacterized protein n=1 Tax=Citricoccus parietis TaxID=592307 RepID=A0ABV5G5Z7_9MICC
MRAQSAFHSRFSVRLPAAVTESWPANPSRPVPGPAMEHDRGQQPHVPEPRHA